MMVVRNNSGWAPVGQAVLLRAFELEERRSKIAIPESVAMSSASCDTAGIVVAIGPDCWKGANESPRAKLGDKVLITRFAGGSITGEDGYVYRMVPSHAIYAVKEDNHG
jgi:co-chaperonin GroES (HSP10)